MKKYILILIAGGMVFSGCKKNFLDLQENPNFPSTVPAASLLAAAEASTANVVVDPSLATVNAWIQYWAFSPNYAVNQDTRDYRFTTSFGQGAFNDLYQNAFDYQKIIDFGAAQGNPALEGIGRTMKSFLMQWAVDVWNNVPYSEAFKGATNKAPKYDDAKSIYDSLYVDLSRAVSLFNNAAAVFPNNTQDLMFGGSKDKWIRFANTIKLRLLLRQSGRADRASYISGKLASDFSPANGSVHSFFLQKGQSAFVNPGYTNSANKQNPYWANFGYSPSGTKTGNNDFFKVSAYAMNFYATQSDDRIFFVAKPVSSGGVTLYGYHFLGNEMGSQGNGAVTYSDVMDDSKVGGTASNPQAYRSPSEPQLIMGDFESLFLQAEAIQRGWFTGSAQNKFDTAVIQSFTWDFDRVDGAGSGLSYYQNDLIPTADNNWAMASDKIKLIITQKWAALNTLNFWEPWIEYRRTGFPTVPLSSSASRGPRVPLRLKYPQREYDLNGDNVSAQGTIDQFTSKIWWMP